MLELLLHPVFARPGSKNDSTPDVPVTDKTEPLFADRIERKELRPQSAVEPLMIELQLLLPAVHSSPACRVYSASVHSSVLCRGRRLVPLRSK